jgi:hypothetical protein
MIGSWWTLFSDWLVGVFERITQALAPILAPFYWAFVVFGLCAIVYHAIGLVR